MRKAKIPPLPKRGRGMGAWHPRVRTWWNAVWRSPMAAEYLGADRQRLEIIAELHQAFWDARGRGDPITKLASEIRLQEVAFGLTPVDRHRLHWTVERTEEVDERKGRRKAPAKAADEKDPRDMLRVVS